MSSDPRLDELLTWLATQAQLQALQLDSIRPASDDASFRRYFRIDLGRSGSVIAMDAPPDHENCQLFIAAADAFSAAGARVPRLLAADLERGFLLLEDFGAITYLDQLKRDGGRDADQLYRDAGEALVRLQCGSRSDVFPEYDRALLERELMLYPQWYVAQHRGIELDTDELAQLHRGFDVLIERILRQPSVYVHRDYHSRNLMVLEAGKGPGMLDFQDAVCGPISYDLVSLLRDAYIDWPEAREIDWVVRYWEKARAAGLPITADFGEFYADYEWMGVQRQLKVLGIFARLHHRDGKDRYLADMPRVLAYLARSLSRYEALAPIARIVDRVERIERQTGYTF